MPANEARLAISDAAAVNPPFSRPVAPDSMVSFVPMADVSDTGRRIGNQTRLQREVSVGYTPFEERDVLFAKITPCMENGKGLHALGLVNGIGYGSTEFHVLRAKPGTNDRFLFHWSMSAELRKKAEAFMIGSAGQQRVQSSFFQHFTIPAIAETEQAEAARILDAADEAIERTEALIGKLKAIKAGLLHDLLTRGLDDNGELRDPAKRPEQFGPSSLGMLPKAWTLRPLETVAQIASGVTLGRKVGGSASIEVPYLRVANLQDGYLDLTNVKTVRILPTEVDRLLLRRGDVLLTEGGDFDKLGRGAVWSGEIDPCSYQNHIFRARCDRDVLLPEFLAAALIVPYGKRYFLRHAKQTTSIASVNRTEIGRFPVPCPEPPEQKEIAATLVRYESCIAAEQAYLSKLRRIKKGLMQDLLNGRVRVTQKAEAKEQRYAVQG